MPRKRRSRKQTTPGMPWPTNVPVTPENIAEYQRTHDLYVVESNYAIPVLEDPDQEEWRQV